MPITSVREKTLQLNSTSKIYGSFAEIGAGQETSRWFFRTPGASKTVAKAMSAYDMSFSDSIYGREGTGRYVCESRLMKMLNHEYALLEERLGPETGSQTQFFAFANTVAARSRRTKGRGHGWLGIRWQTEPRTEPSEIRLHIQLLDSRNTLQQEALGIVGVNLIYAAFFASEPEKLIQTLTKDLDEHRVQLDFIAWDNMASQVEAPDLQLLLLKNGLTPAVAFDERGHPQQLAEMTYGKRLVFFEGNYRPVSNYHLDLLQCAKVHVAKDENLEAEKIQPMALIAGSGEGFSLRDYRDRIALLGQAELPSIVTLGLKLDQLLDLFQLNSLDQPQILITPEDFSELMTDKILNKSVGGFLGVMGELQNFGLRFYLCPTLKNDSVRDIDNFKAPPGMQKLFDYFREAQLVRGSKCLNQDHLKIQGEEILAAMKNGVDSWKDKVPEKVAEYVQKHKIFQE